jgi:gas vesicle protein
MRPLGILLGAAVALTTTVVFAQRDAGSKIRGEYYFYGSQAGTAMRAARESSNAFRQYTSNAQPVGQQVALDASDEIGTYLVKAKAHFAYMRKQAQGANDKETLTALDSIDKHLAAAAKSHAEMKETCLKDHIPGQPVLECCKQIDDHLAKAIAEHDALMKRLAAKK